MLDPTAVDKHRTIAIRISLSVGMGVIVALIAIASTWRTFGDDQNLYPEYVATRDAVYGLEEMIREHFGNTPPGSLTDLWPFYYRSHVDLYWSEANMPIDGWARPFIYTVQGHRCTITSLGRDGKPGGAGLDRDLSNTDQRVGRVPATFEQFVFAPLARGVRFTCLVCGVLAFILSLTIIRPSELQGWSLGLLAIKLIATAFGAILVASVLAAVHIPNHH